MTDSIIEEVRAIREQHAASLDYDLDKIYADLKARQEKHAAEKDGLLSLLLPTRPQSLTWLCSGFVSRNAVNMESETDSALARDVLRYEPQHSHFSMDAPPSSAYPTHDGKYASLSD